jgi:hypothetical protein
MESLYPAGPQAVPKTLTQPGRQYKQRAWWAVASLFQFAILLLAPVAQANQFPACSTVLTSASKVVHPYTGATATHMIGLCDGRVMVSNSSGAQVYDALSGSVVHEITEPLQPKPLYVRSRNAVYFLEPVYPTQKIIEFNLTTGAKRVSTLARPVTSLLGAAGRLLLVNTAIDPSKEDSWGLGTYQVEAFDPDQGTLMPVVGSDFGIGHHHSFGDNSGSFKELSRIVGLPLNSDFVPFRSGVDPTMVYGVYRLDPDSLLIRFRDGLRVSLARWLVFSPDQTHMLSYFGGGSTWDYVYYDEPVGKLGYFARSNATLFTPLDMAADSQHLLALDTRYYLAPFSNPDNRSYLFSDFADTSRYTPLQARLSADGRYAIGIFRDTSTGTDQIIAEPLAASTSLPPATVEPLPVPLSGLVDLATVYPLAVRTRYYQTRKGTESVAIASVATTAAGKEVVVHSRGTTFTYVVDAQGMALKRLHKPFRFAGLVTVPATVHFTPAIPVLPATATVGDSQQLSGQARLVVAGEGEVTVNYRGWMSVEALREETWGGSARPVLQMYNTFSFDGILLDDFPFAMRFEERGWYAADMGLVRFVELDTKSDSRNGFALEGTLTDAPVATSGDGGGGGGGALGETLLLLLGLAVWRRGRA